MLDISSIANQCLIDHAYEAIFVCSEAGVIESVNDAAARLFDYPQAELVGREIALLLTDGSTEGERRFMGITVRDSSLIEDNDTELMCTLQGRKRGGERFPVLLASRKISIEGVSKYTAITRDLREPELPASASLQALDDLAAADESNLVTSLHDSCRRVERVLAALGRLMQVESSSQLQDALSLGDESEAEIAQRINEFLDFQQLVHGKLALASVVFNLRRLVHAVVSMFRRQAQSKGVTLSCSYDDNLPPLFVGDPVRISQILYHLLSNAIKFTDSGEIAMTVQAYLLADHRYKLDITVRDTGIGIDAGVLPLLLSADNAQAASEQESWRDGGLGLPLSQKLVAAMDGGIEVDSVAGHGATFSIHIPIRAQCLNSVAGIDAADGGSKVEPKVGIICSGLYGTDNNVADCVSILPDAMYFAEQMDSDIVPAVTQLLEHERLNLLVIYRRHVDSSLALARKIRQVPALRRLAVLVLANDSRPEHGRVVRDLGLAGLLKGPFTYEAVQRVIRRALHSGASPGLPPGVPVMMPEDTSRLLVVEDNPVNQKVVVALLKEMGVTADVAGSGEEAVAMAACVNYPVILMDCRMPGMDGYEATARIRLQETSYKSVIIAMTASVMAGDRERCLRAGMDDYIEKPLAYPALKQKLSYWLQDANEFASTGT